MPYNPNIHHRKSIRLKGYDYSQAGLYFITICVQDRLCLFGEIENGEMVWNDAGCNAHECWLQIPNHFPNVILHEYIVMPNHVHGIIELVGANNYSPETRANENGAKYFSPLRSPSKTIGSIVGGYKIGVTKWFRENGIMDTIWQRNYWEHIIRDEQSHHPSSNCHIHHQQPEKFGER